MRLMAPLERTRRAVMWRAVSRKTKLCAHVSTCIGGEFVNAYSNDIEEANDDCKDAGS